MKNKKLLFIFGIICVTVFLILYYIFHSFGNNNNINQEEIAYKILDSFNEYEANINIKVISNKTENYYEVTQKVTKEKSKQVVNKPDNIKNLEFELEDNRLKISNSNLDMEKVFDNYINMYNNSLFLNTFVNDYKENDSNYYNNKDELIYEVKMKNSNTYAKYKQLHVDKNTSLPKELIIKDNTKKVVADILYNDIKIK